MINHKAYPKYKDSGVEWLGEIPEGWELTRLGSRFFERRTKVSDEDFAALSVTKNGILPQLDSAAKTNDGDNRKLVRKGDFVINSRSDRKGSSGIAMEDGSVSLINIVMAPEDIHPIYCNYLLKGNSFIEEFYRNGHGIVADLWTTRYSEMKNIKIGIPSFNEQIAIASFLDDKVGKIEEAIVQKEQLIQLLGERKQIIIQNAVTKGLNPNAPMKDSGIEWIGEIPEHWEVKKVGHIAKVGNGSTPNRSVMKYWKAGWYPWLNSGTIHQEVIVYSDQNVTSKAIEECHLTCLKPGAVLIAITGQGKTRGASALLSIEATVNQHIAYIQLRVSFLSSEWLHLFLRSQYSQLRRISESGSTKGALTCDDIRNYKVVVPPYSEQQNIIQFINNSFTKIHQAIHQAEQSIKTLKEYKVTLINSAVTGKIKVSNEY